MPCGGHEPSMKSQPCILLPIALLLIGVGLFCLLFFGLGNIEPYSVTRDFRSAHCLVLSANVSGFRACPPSSNDSELAPPAEPNVTEPALPIFPCLMLYVNYTEKPHEEVIKEQEEGRLQFLQGPGMLHDTHDTWLQQRSQVAAGTYNDTVTLQLNLVAPNSSVRMTPGYWHNFKTPIIAHEMLFIQLSNAIIKILHVLIKGHTKCTLQICSSSDEHNAREVSRFQAAYGQTDQTFRCYFDPKDRSNFFLYIVTGNQVIHMILWPGLAMGFGIFILVVVIFQSCEIWVCHKVLTRPSKANYDSQGRSYRLASRTDSDRSATSTASFLRDRYSDTTASSGRSTALL
ncbi:hypothetical protein CAPTEDRAFT_223975 [Capitella teleta]|uniref:Uncharacterized protein n=1 Tax=Capitella teleta TaxID=283909 RepID=R7UZP4_CAPTE|nr:hypothetical protein CAPTEDRAFT_223975 [Capitella teleta]|eukprot:ELU09432.1 hypothetical protein CAPTEDRAFT_223975 [Capitella teleta]